MLWIGQPPAYLLALLALVAAGTYVFFRLRLAGLSERARALEAAVARRTADLNREREGLSLANQQLAEANAQLTAARSIADTSHRHLRLMLDQLHIGVIVLDAREQVLFASEAASRLLVGEAGADPVGRSLQEVLPVDAEALADVRTRLLSPQAGVRLTAWLASSSGQRYWTEIEARVDPRDERCRILYLYDVTETYEARQSGGAEDQGAIAGLIGRSTTMRLVHDQIRNLAGVDATVLIEGETGTGKELVARSIHEASRRRARPFVAINCAGLTESLLASQLFGHKRGAFTGAVTDHVGLFEAAQGGTLLLDEIGDMPMSMQTHLLRVLQEREIIRVGDSRPRSIDVRVLVATHRSLEQEVADGRFREDLLYRIRVTRIPLPPLRQRGDDVPQLATTFMSQLSAEHGKKMNGIARDAMDCLVAHRWPGNVRELRAMIEWAVIRASGPVIRLSDLPPELSLDDVPPPRPPMPDAERRLLIETLRRAQGNRSKAARLLGVSRATFYRRLAALEGLPPGLPPSSPSVLAGDAR